MVARHEVVIVGGGLAGAATGWALAARGQRDVLLLEREATPGAHSSGRNAGMVRRGVEDPALAPLAREGAAWIERLGVPYRRTGSYLIDGDRHVPAAVRDGFLHRIVGADEAAARVPLLAGAALPAVLETPDDGIVEVHALLEAYLEGLRTGGGTVCCGVAAGPPRVRDGRVVGLETSAGPIACRALVVANGAWAGVYAVAAGVPIPLAPIRRHIICTASPTGGPPWDWPWVWDLAAGFYFRPEAAGLLWSPCDELPDVPGTARVDAAAPRWLAEKLAARLPAASELQVRRQWAGHRSFTPDRRFLLGPDPRLAGWHWAVGLGGHGVTTSAAVGRRVADALLGEGSIPEQLAVRPAVLEPAPGEPGLQHAPADPPPVGPVLLTGRGAR